MNRKSLLTSMVLAAVVLLLPDDLTAQGYKNGNRLALDYSRADETARTQMREELAGVAHSFRYLEVTDMTIDDPEKPRRIDLLTVEPSSDVEIHLVVTRRNSLQLAQTLEIGEYVAADGRVHDLAENIENRIVLQPVRLNHKDREGPKHGPELLREVDPDAH